MIKLLLSFLWSNCSLPSDDRIVAYLPMIRLLLNLLWVHCCLPCYDGIDAHLPIIKFQLTFRWSNCCLPSNDQIVAYFPMMEMFLTFLWSNYCLPSYDLPSGSETWRPCGTTHLPWPHPEIPDWLLRLALSNDWLPQTTLMKPFGLWLWLSEKTPDHPPALVQKVVYTSGRVGRSFLFQRARLNIKKSKKKFSVD